MAMVHWCTIHHVDIRKNKGYGCVYCELDGTGYSDVYDLDSSTCAWGDFFKYLTECGRKDAASGTGLYILKPLIFKLETGEDALREKDQKRKFKIKQREVELYRYFYTIGTQLRN